MLGKHCPYCRHLVHITFGDTDGKCDRCYNTFLVKYHLSKIKLAKTFIPRDYEAEILAFIRKRKRTYAGEISCNVGISKGVVSVTLQNLAARRIIIISPRGKTKWVTLQPESLV